MKWLKELFSGKSSHPAPVDQVQAPVTRQPDLVPEQHASPPSSWRTTSPAEFVSRAVVGAAYCRIPLVQIPDMAERLSKELMARGVPSSEMTDLFNNGLLGVCPECRQYCAGGLMLSLAMYSALGAGNITFMTDQSGGGPKQRLLGGQCGTSSCANRDFYHLFWCPDLHPDMLQYLKADFNIAIDPHTQVKRSHVWRPHDLKAETNTSTHGTPPSPAASGVGPQKREGMTAYSEQQRKEMYLEWHKACLEMTLDATRRGMTARDSIQHGGTESMNHFMRTYGLSREEANSIIDEGMSKWGPLAGKPAPGGR